MIKYKILYSSRVGEYILMKKFLFFKWKLHEFDFMYKSVWISNLEEMEKIFNKTHIDQQYSMFSGWYNKSWITSDDLVKVGNEFRKFNDFKQQNPELFI